jgi:hypothetical protein
MFCDVRPGRCAGVTKGVWRPVATLRALMPSKTLGPSVVTIRKRRASHRSYDVTRQIATIESPP